MQLVLVSTKLADPADQPRVNLQLKHRVPLSLNMEFYRVSINQAPTFATEHVMHETQLPVLGCWVHTFPVVWPQNRVILELVHFDHDHFRNHPLFVGRSEEEPLAWSSDLSVSFRPRRRPPRPLLLAFKLGSWTGKSHARAMSRTLERNVGVVLIW